MHLTEEELREHLKQKITLRAVICIIYDNEGNLNCSTILTSVVVIIVHSLICFPSYFDCESKKNNMLDFLIVLYR